MVSQMHTEEMELNIELAKILQTKMDGGETRDHYSGTRHKLIELGLIEVLPISNGQLGVIVLTKAGNERLLNHILKLLDTIASQS